MKIITRSESGRSVGAALKKCITEINLELETVDGEIIKAQSEVSAGPSGGQVAISVAVSGSAPYKKSVFGINHRGKSREASTKRATEKLNSLLADKKGDVVDVFTVSITTPFPRRTYTTIIAAVNEETLIPALNASQRRARLNNILELLNGDPKSINISKVAEIFGVSRLIIYKDLEELGHKRTSGG